MNERLRVLITDDEEGMRLGVERALRKFSARFPDMDVEVAYDLDLAATGEEAVEKLDAGRYDILLLDYKLPGISGLDVLSHVQEKGGETATVMMTAYASLNTAISATKKGAFDFLAKPFTPEELRSTVRKATRSLIVHRQARKLAEEKRKVRFQFISVLSHELKAPIGAVEGYLNLLKTGSVKDEETMQHVLERSLNRLGGMRKLIFDILDLTRIESGEKQRNLGPVDLVAVAKSAMELVESAAADRNVRVSLDSPGELVIEGDASELEIVMNNLVSNAVKYNEDDGQVKIVLARTDKGAVLSVADTGIGLTPEEQQKLFGEFVRIKNAKTRGIEGSGLGLSTVKKIAALYDGDVTVDSEFGKGSKFTVRFNSAGTEE